MSNKNCCKHPGEQINYSIMKEQFYCPHEKVQQCNKLLLNLDFTQTSMLGNVGTRVR